MGWVDSLKGAVVGLDTAPLIYFIEANPTYVSLVRPFFQALDRGELSVITSTVTLGEVLVHPLRKGDAPLVQRYHDVLLGSGSLIMKQVISDIAEEAARLRAVYNLRTPDAIQLATAIT
ncbi:MAG: type II toxin-antitoxin system VapC family toxin, partial [Ktedonobacterales bacterium]